MLNHLKTLLQKLAAVFASHKRDQMGQDDDIPQVGDPLDDTGPISVVPDPKNDSISQSRTSSGDGQDDENPEVGGPVPETGAYPRPRSCHLKDDGQDGENPEVGGPMKDTGAYRTLPARKLPRGSLLDWLRKMEPGGWSPPEPTEKKA